MTHLAAVTVLRFRRWLAAGICGALIIAALPLLWDAWVINHAGVLINRAIVELDQAGGDTTAIDTSSALNPAAEAALQEAMELTEAAAERGPHTVAREIPIWRTYGAAASLLPSNHAFELLLRSRNAGRLDRIGELWLGEVASATQHWDEAKKAFTRIDAGNLLIHRGEIALAAGDKQTAVRHFQLAKASLDAAAERETAQQLLLDRTGNKPSVASELIRNPGERATALSQIGRDLLAADEPAQAVPILEEALAAAETDSPGAVGEQSILLNLALALAKTLPEPRFGESTAAPTYLALDEEAYTQIKALIRIRALAYKGIALNPTASAYVQGGRVLMLTGDEGEGIALLQKALSLDPLWADAYLTLGQWYENHGLLTIARELYAQGVKKLPGNAELAGVYAIAAYKTLRPEDALSLLKQAASMNSNNPYVYVLLGDCYADLGSLPEAVETYKMGLDKFPSNEPLLARLAKLSRGEESVP